MVFLPFCAGKMQNSNLRQFRRLLQKWQGSEQVIKIQARPGS
jgi:hypothetical protein